MRIKWPDLKLPPINLWNAPKLNRSNMQMATYDNVVRSVKVYDDGIEYEFKHFIFYEIMPDRTKDFSAELFEINGVECSAQEAEQMMGEDNFKLALETASESTGSN